MQNPFEIPQLFSLTGVKLTEEALDSNIVSVGCKNGAGCGNGGGCISGGAALEEQLARD
jgi:hypothetical protein